MFSKHRNCQQTNYLSSINTYCILIHNNFIGCSTFLVFLFLSQPPKRIHKIIKKLNLFSYMECLTHVGTLQGIIDIWIRVYSQQCFQQLHSSSKYTIQTVQPQRKHWLLYHIQSLFPHWMALFCWCNITHITLILSCAQLDVRERRINRQGMLTGMVLTMILVLYREDHR